MCEELDAALAGGRVDVVLEAAALGLPAGGVVGEVLPFLARARGLLHTHTLVSHHQGDGGGDLLEALVQGRPVVRLPVLPAVAARAPGLGVQVEQLPSAARALTLQMGNNLILYHLLSTIAPPVVS